jgi:hypothetical protein
MSARTAFITLAFVAGMLAGSMLGMALARIAAAPDTGAATPVAVPEFGAAAVAPGPLLHGIAASAEEAQRVR